MPDYVDTTTLQLYRSHWPQPANTAGLTRAEYDAASAIPGQYRKWTGSAVVEMTQGEKDTVDAAALSAQRDSTAAQLEQVEDVMRAFALTVLDEFNGHADKLNAILDAADNAVSLADFKARMGLIDDYPQRTVAQLKTSLRNKLGS
jgi:hypothetical protein